MSRWLWGTELGANGALVWTTELWLVGTVSVVALVLWSLVFWGSRTQRSRWTEAVLVGLALAGLVVALAGPTWVEEEGRTESARLAVLIDASKSMDVLEDGQPRSSRVAELLNELDGPSTDWYHFGSELVVGRPAAYDLGNTDIGGALENLADRVAGERLSGVVLITDGLDRGLLRKRFRSEDGASVGPLPGPLTIYQIGQPEKVTDLSIREVSAGGFAFKLEPFKIRAHLQGSGFENKTIPVRLERDGSPVSELSVTLDDKGRGEAEFKVRPDDVGRFTYEVSVPEYENDAVPSNNRYPVVIRVVRDRIRVLQVAGAPSWDVKMLRRFLKGDPSVDLVSFFILRTNPDLDTDYRDDELSLIEFPTEKLFNEELWRFDLVVFQNFDYEPYFGYRANAMLENIRKYVEDEGHAFVMTGGDRSFDLGKYAGTPVEGILPVALGVLGSKADEAQFKPELTAAGQRHPITLLAPNAEENGQWWERLHASDGANMVAGAAKGASVLLTHPGRRTKEGKPMPVLAVKEAGRGRTMALTVDSSWRWSFSEAAAGRGNQAYMRFWKNAFRWLLAEPAANRVLVETPKENYRIGDTVRIVVQARNVDFEPLPGATVKVEVHHLDMVEQHEGLTGEDGEMVLEVPALRQGPHRVDVVVQRNQKNIGDADTVYAVSTLDPELEEVSADSDFLSWMANDREGKWVAPNTYEAPLRDASAGRTVWDKRETALANAPLLALWIGLLAGVAWIVRRRSGLR